MKRKPDYVFNVWGDGEIELAKATAKMHAAHLRCRNISIVNGFGITHRIRVFMKGKA